MRTTIASGAGAIPQTISANFKLYSGDAVDVVILQTTGAAQNVNLMQVENVFTGYKVY